MHERANGGLDGTPNSSSRRRMTAMILSQPYRCSTSSTDDRHGALTDMLYLHLAEVVRLPPDMPTPTASLWLTSNKVTFSRRCALQIIVKNNTVHPFLSWTARMESAFWSSFICFSGRRRLFDFHYWIETLSPQLLKGWKTWVISVDTAVHHIEGKHDR